MRLRRLLLLACLACGCENQKLIRIQQQNVMVQAEIKQCLTATKALEHEKGRLATLRQQEKALQKEIQSLLKSKKPH